jgi:hypothetical protein
MEVGPRPTQDDAQESPANAIAGASSFPLLGIR